MSDLKTVANALKNADNILVLSHVSPDGDTLGSATALIRTLRNMGKKADFACDDIVGKKYEFLFDNLENIGFDPDFIVSVDAADPKLLGENGTKYTIDIGIDHHRTNVINAKINYVDSKAASNTLIIYDLIKELQEPICPLTATGLYTGLSTDTGCFRYTNADARAYRAAADLIELGANAPHINRLMFDTKSMACLAVEKNVFSNMQFYLDGKMLLVEIPQKLLIETNAQDEDLDGIPSITRGVEGVLLGITLKEKSDGIWKASLRAVSPVDASVICKSLGGGGHKGAAGCSLTTNYEESKKLLVDTCKKYLEDNNL